MKRLIICYVLIALFLLIKNLIHLIHCNYIRTKFIINHKNGAPEKNYILKNSIDSIIKRANVDNTYAITANILDKFSYASNIGNYLLQAQAEYIYRCEHSLFWGYYLLTKMLLFKPIFERKKNVFISVLYCCVEGIGIHLICSLLDRKGIVDKILTLATDYLFELWKYIPYLK